RVVGQVGAHAGAVGHHRDVVLAQVVGGPDAGQHQQLRAADGPAGQDDLRVGHGELLGAPVQVANADGPAALDLDRGGQCVGEDGQVGPGRGRVQVGVGRRPAPAAALGDLVIADAVLPGAVEVVVGGLPAGLGGGHERAGLAGLVAQVLDAERAHGAV